MDNNAADTAAKEVIDMPGENTSRLPYTGFFSAVRKAINSKWSKKCDKSTSKLNNIKPHM